MEPDYLQFCFYYAIQNDFYSACMTDLNINNKTILRNKIISKFMELVFLLREITNAFNMVNDIKKHIILFLI